MACGLGLKIWIIPCFCWSMTWFLNLRGIGGQSIGSSPGSGDQPGSLLPFESSTQLQGFHVTKLVFDGNFGSTDFVCMDAASIGNSSANNGSFSTTTELRLTNSSSSSASNGRCLYKRPLPLVKQSLVGYVASFKTMLQFYVEDPSGTGEGEGEGMVIMLVPSTESPLNSSGGYLGWLNGTSIPYAPSTFAVEIDTKQELEFSDPVYHHVGLDIDSLKSLSFGGLGLNDSSNKIRPGTLYNVWVNWNASMGLAEVNLVEAALDGRTGSYKSPDWESVPEPPLFTAAVSVFLGATYTFHNPNMYIGFSSSTGIGSINSFHVTYWELEYWEENPPSPENHTGRKVLLLSVILSCLAVLVIALFVASSWLKWRLDKAKALNSGRLSVNELENLDKQYGPHCFAYRDLNSATKSFSSKQILGTGGFGSVYKGTLSKTRETVAVKRISQTSRQGAREFMAEVKIIGRLRHKNLVKLLGWCFERGELLLVYEYMPNGSLDRSLYPPETSDPAIPKSALSWKQRVKIVTGVASALVYLHEEWEHRVVHRDVKSSNVMLDANLNARLGDFGLARQYAHSQAPHSTVMAGTLGYLAPEFLASCRATEKTDVFSFGVLAMETVTATRPLRLEAGEMVVLVDWVWDMFKDGQETQAIDPRLGTRSEDDEKEMLRVLQLALLCCHPDPNARPTMRQALHILAWEAPLPYVPRSKPVPIFFHDRGQEVRDMRLGDTTSDESSMFSKMDPNSFETQAPGTTSDESGSLFTVIVDTSSERGTVLKSTVEAACDKSGPLVDEGDKPLHQSFLTATDKSFPGEQD